VLPLFGINLRVLRIKIQLAKLFLIIVMDVYILNVKFRLEKRDLEC